MSHKESHIVPAAFTRTFPELVATILDEWSQVDEAALSATLGELDKVVALVAERTGRTKALARRQLEEIYQVVTQPRYGFLSGPRSHIRKNVFLSVVSALGFGFLFGLFYRLKK